MSYIGDVPFSSTVHGRFTTVNASGVPTTLGNTPTAEFYVNAGTTAFTAGLSLTADIGRTGVNHVSCVVTTSASGFVSGANYSVVVAAGTVSGVSMIGYPVYEFSVANRSALMPTTALTKLAVNAGNQAAIDWGNVGNQSTSVNLSATTINIVNTATAATTVASVSGNVSANTVQMAGVAVNASAFPVGVTAGQAGGLFIAGTNANTTVSLTSNITGNLSGSVGSVTGSVNSVTSGVTVTTNNDKTGYTVSTNQDKTGYAITSNIKKNQALSKFRFLMTDSTNHAPKTGLTVTCTRDIGDGNGFVAGTLANVAEISNGIYTVDFLAADLHGNVVVLQATATNADTTFERIVTQP